MTLSSRIPDSHPRAASLRVRERLIEAWREGIVAEAGLIAHGRGEAFDYLLGEKTIPPVRKAIAAAAAMLLESKKPIISVNGNSAALSATEIVKLSQVTGAKLEINLFYRTDERVSKIADLLKRDGATEVLGTNETLSDLLPGIESERRRIDPKGMMQSDLVLVPLEDGDRTQALRNAAKRVVAIDLNPLSRTARSATISIVDNIIRAMPMLVSEARRLAGRPSSELRTIVESFDNEQNLSDVISFIADRLGKLSQEGLLEAR